MNKQRNPFHLIGDDPGDKFVMIPYALARDGELSASARSVAMYMRTHRDGWELSAKSIAEALKMDRGAVSKALRGLSDCRWLAIRETGRTNREYFMHRSRRLTEAEHAEYTCGKNQQGVAGKTSKGLLEKPSTPLPEIPATKKTIQEDHAEDQQEDQQNSPTHLSAYGLVSDAREAEADHPGDAAHDRDDEPGRNVDYIAEHPLLSSWLSESTEEGDEWAEANRAESERRHNMAALAQSICVRCRFDLKAKTGPAAARGWCEGCHNNEFEKETA